MEKKVLQLLSRLGEVEQKLGNPKVFEDQKAYRELTQEHSRLTEIKNVWGELQKSKQHLTENRQLLQAEKDPDFISMLEEEISEHEANIPTLQAELENLLVPPDPTDNDNTILELRAGTGGDEAALFVGDCVRMYKMYADKKGWRYEELSSTPSEAGGYKEYVMVISGPQAYRLLKHEGGTHRVQRVPETETQGRVHTSAITVAVLREPEEEEEIDIDEKELKIDTYRASGAGGQHVNVTDSAVRITHLPTGVVAHCQEERSQHKNKAKAMRLLTAKIAEIEREKIEAARASDRATQVGTGDRSGRIRTYNFPQNRVTDHRISLTLYNLDYVMEGDLDAFTNALVANSSQQKLQT